MSSFEFKQHDYVFYLAFVVLNFEIQCMLLMIWCYLFILWIQLSIGNVVCEHQKQHVSKDEEASSRFNSRLRISRLLGSVFSCAIYLHQHIQATWLLSNLGFICINNIFLEVLILEFWFWSETHFEKNHVNSLTIEVNRC